MLCQPCFEKNGAQHEAPFFIAGVYKCEHHAKNSFLRRFMRLMGLS
jgi:hypothetical protein